MISRPNSAAFRLLLPQETSPEGDRERADPHASAEPQAGKLSVPGGQQKSVVASDLDCWWVGWVAAP